ncbi:MAG: ABC transporter permease [Caldilinea sp.]
MPTWNRLSSLIRKEFIQITHDPRTLAMTFIMPVAMMFLLGYAATNDVRNIALVVLDQDQTPASRQLIDAYRVADYFVVERRVASEQELREAIDHNLARAGLIIPPGYSYPVTVDSFPKEVFTGTVRHIADRAEFTPRNVQTTDSRKTTVFAVRLDLAPSAGKLKPGMPADVNFGGEGVWPTR